MNSRRRSARALSPQRIFPGFRRRNPLHRAGAHPRRWGLSLLCALALLPVHLRALDPTKSVFQYNIQNWARQDGLPSDKVTAIAQTSDGYIWFGTQNGLARFDGLEFKRVPISLPGSAAQEVKHLAAARDGGLWIALSDGQFCHFDGRTFSALARFGESPQRASILEARDGSVWFGSDDLLGRRTAAGVETFADMTKIISLLEDDRGRIWIGTDERGVFTWADGKIERALPDANLENETIHGMAFDRRGNLCLSGNRYVLCFNSAGELTDKLSHGGGPALYDRHGALWVTTLDGLVRFQDGKSARLRASDGLGGEYVTCVLEDREGSIWVGTLNGLTQVSDVKFPMYSTKDGLASASVLSVAPSREGGIWATSHRGITYFDGTKFRNHHNSQLFPNPYVKLGMEARNGDFYCVDARKTINVVSNGKLLARYPNEEWPEALAEDDESVLAGVGASLLRIKDGQLQPYQFKGPAPDFQRFENLWVARDGAIWVASYAGLYRVIDGEYQRWSAAEGLSSNQVNHVFEDDDGAIWASLPTGMARLKGGVVRNIRAANGLYDERVFTIVPDDHGYFWVNSGRGIFRVARNDLNAFADGRADRVECEPFDTRDAVKFTDRHDQEPSGCRSADGRIWFPSPFGIIMIDPANFVRNPTVPPVYIEAIHVNGQPVPDRDHHVFEVGHEHVEFFFAALSYISPKNVKVRYRLEGLDSRWNDAGSRRSALYSLKPGSYTFRVQAANADGVWNEAGATYSFELPPPFHQTAAFYLLCSIGGVLLLLAAYGWKVRALKLRQRKLQEANELLEAKVNERTAELAYERDLLRALLQNSPDPIFFKDTESRFVAAADVFARRVGVGSPEALVGKSDFDFFASEHAQASLEDEREIIRTGQPLVDKVEREMWTDGRTTWVITTKVPWRDKDGKIIGTFGLSKDITKLKESEQKLVDLHKQLLDASRQAGMAEVATGVLHNVGNVLNSVNVSATLVIDQVRASRVAFVGKLSELLDQHTADLAAFFTSDPKGRKIPSYLAQLSQQLLTEREQVVQELGQLRKNIEHIKEIVVLQQSFAKVSGVAETVPLSELVEDAIRMNTGALERHQVELVRDYQAPINICVERHKVIQILINLIRNAKYACDDSGRVDKRIVVRTRPTELGVEIAVIDNGIGIAPENLTRIFSHGFTTRKDGHGFGLHSGANTARELGGRLEVASPGLGHGAAFTLDLPLQPPQADSRHPDFNLIDSALRPGSRRTALV